MVGKYEEINQLIALIYSASLDQSKWNEVMKQMATLFDGAAAILAFADLNGESRTNRDTTMVRWHDYNAGPENVQLYLDYADKDLRTAYGLARPGQVYVDQDFIDDKAMDNHVFYQDFLRLFDMRYSVGVSVPTSPSQCIVANVIRSSRQGHADRGAIELMGMLYPHVAQAVRIGDKLAQLNLENVALRDAFDHLTDGVFITSGDGAIIIANQAAETMMQAKEGLHETAGTLSASHKPTADALRELIAKTAKTALDISLEATALAIPKPSDGRPLHLIAMPVVTSMEAQFTALSRKHAVFLIVSDPDQQPTTPTERLKAIFGLTASEARLAAELVAGVSISDYAEKAGITENTARWTLKQVQAKTDCHRQADLVRLLASTTKVF